MEIQRAKELRDKLQDDILLLVQKFEEDTKTNVDRIWLSSMEFIDDPLPKTMKVLIEFRF